MIARVTIAGLKGAASWLPLEAANRISRYCAIARATGGVDEDLACCACELKQAVEHLTAHQKNY